MQIHCSLRRLCNLFKFLSLINKLLLSSPASTYVDTKAQVKQAHWRSSVCYNRFEASITILHRRKVQSRRTGRFFPAMFPSSQKAPGNSHGPLQKKSMHIVPLKTQLSIVYCLHRHYSPLFYFRSFWLHR